VQLRPGSAGGVLTADEVVDGGGDAISVHEFAMDAGRVSLLRAPRSNVLITPRIGELLRAGIAHHSMLRHHRLAQLTAPTAAITQKPPNAVLAQRYLPTYGYFALKTVRQPSGKCVGFRWTACPVAGR
jgi:hypothetical protein